MKHYRWIVFKRSNLFRNVIKFKWSKCANPVSSSIFKLLQLFEWYTYKKKKKKKKKNAETGQIRGTSLAIIKTIGEIAIDRLRRRTLQHPSDTFLGASAWLVVRVEPREITSLNTSNHRKKGRPKTYETDLNMNYGIRWFVSSARDFSYGNML